MKTKYIFLFLFLSFLISTTLYGQNISTTLFTIKNGLPSNYIFYTYQDHDGYLWIATTNGVSRFDGKNFKNYGKNHGLPSVFVDRVFEDSQGRLWLGTRAGICELKGDSCHFTPVDDGLKIAFVSGFFENDHQLIATTNRGAYKLNGAVWEKIQLMPGHENSLINGLLFYADEIYVNFENKVIAMRDSLRSWKVIAEKKIEGSYFNGLFLSGREILVSNYHGLDRIESDNWYQHYRLNSAQNISTEVFATMSKIFG